MSYEDCPRKLLSWEYTGRKMTESCYLSWVEEGVKLYIAKGMINNNEEKEEDWGCRKSC